MNTKSDSRALGGAGIDTNKPNDGSKTISNVDENSSFWSLIDRLKRTIGALYWLSNGYLFIAIIATVYLASALVDSQSGLFWNGVKVALVAVPLIAGLFCRYVFQQLKEIPESIRTMSDSDSVESIQALIRDRSQINVFGTVKLVNQIRQQSLFEELFDSIRGVGILASPLFWLLMIASSILLTLFMLAAVIVAIF